MTGNSRVDIGKQHPACYKALLTLSTTAEESAAAAGLDPLLVELIKIRVSQINGCAFCLRVHTRASPKKGENSDRLAVLPLWAETGYFTAPSAGMPKPSFLRLDDPEHQRLRRLRVPRHLPIEMQQPA
ncbi:carboxymuconolactone decarboxylase family protein [Streptomyces sp. NPDC059101]|uniref:carboxymuconolactone decarboxylase family protein n=1 Tax=unclassified Streptomyces TaxID=2593676 RepID=UPI0036756B3B